MKKPIKLLVGVLTVFVLSSPVLASEFRVEVKIDRSDPLEAALRAARVHRRVRPDDTIVIIVPSGVLRRRSALEIGPADSGLPFAPLVIRGAPQGGTKVSGAITIHGRALSAGEGHGRPPGTRLVSRDEIGALRPLGVERRGAYTVPATSRLELFQGDRRLHFARWPKQGYSSDIEAGQADSSGRVPVIAPTDRLPNWRNEKQLWFGGYFAYDWAYETIPAVARNSDGDLLLEKPLTPFPTRKSFRYFVFNALSELTEPGEFVIDSERQEVLFLPFSTQEPVEAAVAEGLLHIRNAKHVIIENVAFEKTLGPTVTVTDSEDIVIRDSFIGQSGGDALAVIGGERFLLDRSVVADVSERAVTVSGGDRRSLIPSRHEVRNSIVTNFGKDSRTYRPGVLITGVGILLEGSVIANGPHSGIVISGNDNTIKNNELFSLVQETEDAGAVYMGRDWTQRGNLVEGNFFHDIGKPGARQSNVAFGVYLDDQFSGTKILRNVFFNVSNPVLIGGGRDNDVEDNVFVSPRPAGVMLDSRGLNWQRAHEDPDSPLMKNLRLVDVSSQLWRMRYPSLANIEDDEPGAPKGNVLKDNTAIGGVVVQFLDATAQSYTRVEGSTEPAIDDNPPSIANVKALTDLFSRIEHLQLQPSLKIAERRKALSRLLFFSRAFLSDQGLR